MKPVNKLLHNYHLTMDLVRCSRVILLGDLNYRVSLPEETTRLLVDKGEWSTLLKNDQVDYQWINCSPRTLFSINYISEGA